jgi:hypothetical protein
MQHVQIKLFASELKDARVEDAIPVFHRWIQSGVLPGLWIDVADYSHVPAGPGVLLIGHEANVSLDEAGGRLGLLYSKKTVSGGDAESNLHAAYQTALAAAKRLEAEPEFAGKLCFRLDEVQVILNDRLQYSNTAATWDSVSGEIEAFLGSVIGAPLRIERSADPRERLWALGRRA